MKILKSVAEMREARGEWKSTVGFVPTMGALHAGHFSLLKRARESCAVIGASIFVNPTQFNDAKDLEKYPRPLEQDLAGLRDAGVDFVFLPLADEIYADKYRYQLSEKELSPLLEGAHRPGHFEGMLTVVLKLLNLVRPTQAFFGEKDYQQLRLIQGMAAALFLESEIIGCPTLREADGLAKSSRNVRLTPEQREKAPMIYKALTQAASTTAARTMLEDAGFRVDYVAELGERRLAAAFLGDVRLIDNV